MRYTGQECRALAAAWMTARSLKFAIVVGALLMMSGLARAAPVLLGPLIHAVTTDKQSYSAGQIAHVLVSLTNRTGRVFNGSLSAVMTGRGRVVGTTVVSPTINLDVKQSKIVDLAFSMPDSVNGQGYLVSVAATDQAGSVDAAAAALDLSSDWSSFPRECFVTNFVAGTKTSELVDGLNAWHCNVLQFYDVNYQQQTPYSPDATWQNLGNKTISRSVVESYIKAAHGKRMGVFDYTLWNGAYPSFVSNPENGSMPWGMFVTGCAPHCGLANMAGTPSDGGTGSLFPAGWAASWLAEMDPTNAGWIDRFEKMNAPLIHELGFDGLQIDTLGNPGPVYNAHGKIINLTKALSSFQNKVRAALKTRGVINNVMGWNEADVAANAHEDFYYRETHPEFGDAPYYPAINGLTAAIRQYTSKGIDLPLYMDDTYGKRATCQSGGGSAHCYFNLPGLLYLDATMLAAGAYHVYLADGDRFVSNIYVPGPQLLMAPASIQAEYDYQTFGVAMEKLLRSSVYDSWQPGSILDGAVGGPTGAAGQIYVLPKIRPGIQILHLLNYSTVPTIAVQDVNATQPPAKSLGPLAVKMYYSGSLGSNNPLWLASPDLDHGAPQQLTYSKSYDTVGTYITFTVPTLLYWDMLWLELDGLATSDYATP